MFYVVAYIFLRKPFINLRNSGRMMGNELVGYSRAGDVFHYRWAARRCLNMIHPKSQLSCIVIEGSLERKLAGEYVIDIAEYYSKNQDSSISKIDYYQLKHTTVQKENPFTLSDLEKTIQGFAKRFKEQCLKKGSKPVFPSVTFSIITNRPVAGNLKKNISLIAKSGKPSKRFLKTFKKYSKLNGKNLINFCKNLQFEDSEGDYDAQKYELHREIAQLVAGVVDDPQIDTITAMVQEKVLPNSKNKILREDVLKRFGVTSERSLFPAPPEFEKLENTISREHYQLLSDKILNSSNPVIVHAPGGVGKSICALEIAKNLPDHSLGVVYDCFGGGRYRNRSEPRHRHRDALVQIANELALEGLCSPLIVKSSTLDDEILRNFILRLKIAVKALKKGDDAAKLVIVVDAADNAEMAAKELNEICFIHELLRETFPDGCHLVALCRTERIDLLQPMGTITRSELPKFTEDETLAHLKTFFPSANENDALEFYRLTNNGNPRVQSNALGVNYSTIQKLLASLGPSGQTVDEQIQTQINTAISAVRDKYPEKYKIHVDAICIGLATLPPFIPINVLAAIAEVEEETVQSFISDIGNHILLTDDSIQFRDEPTESWFRENFSANKEQISSYITLLKPLGNIFTYVAEALPVLYLLAEQYDELIKLALSDNLLPENPIDRRNVRIYRLQFAFKAALKQRLYKDASKLALRAGEEMAGDERMVNILSCNVDLVSLLQNEQKVQELAFRSKLQGSWEGSGNVYSASLLSAVNNYKGEARAYLRSAENWLQLHFEERKTHKEREFDFPHGALQDEDIVELTNAHYNLFGPESAAHYMLNWTPDEVIHNVARKFIRRLVDVGDFDAIDKMASLGAVSPFLLIALNHEVMQVGKVPDGNILKRVLNRLVSHKAERPKPTYSYHDIILEDMVTFLEACALKHLPCKKILVLLNSYVPLRAKEGLADSFQQKEREIYCRALALRCVLKNEFEIDFNKILPVKFKNKKNYDNEQKIQKFEEVVNVLFPWCLLRMQIYVNNQGKQWKNEIAKVQGNTNKTLTHNYRIPQSIKNELSRLQVDILIFNKSANEEEVETFYSQCFGEKSAISVDCRLKFVRAAFRLPHLSIIKNLAEQTVSNFINSCKSENTETRAEWFIDLARAVLSGNKNEAAAYFEYSIEAVSKFGIEINERWQAVSSLAKRFAEDNPNDPVIAYRFIRCAELIGDNVEREKYWDRRDALRICTQLSPVSGVTALSRWRDRDVGWFNDLLNVLGDELVSSDLISGAAGWSLSSFFDDANLMDFSILCLEKEQSTKKRQYILDSTVGDLLFHNQTSLKEWKKLKDLALLYNIKNDDLDTIIAQKLEPYQRELNHASYFNSKKDKKNVNWDAVFKGFDLTSTNGIKDSLERYRKTAGRSCNKDDFWKEFYARLNESELLLFFQSLVDSSISRYDVEDALQYLPEMFRQKASVKRNWEKILKSIARCFAQEFVLYDSISYFFDKINERDKEALLPLFRNSVLGELSRNSKLFGPSIFWGTIHTLSHFLSSEEAGELLDFALKRFELHVEDDYADGEWSELLTPPVEMKMALSGFVWSALGSPRSFIRWKAVHCVCRLAAVKAQGILEGLISWIQYDHADAFINPKFPFYNLHALQYLLIAFNRIAIDYPKLLKPYAKMFANYSFSFSSHILINKTASEIALKLENNCPGTLTKKEISRLRKVGISPSAVNKKQKYGEFVDSYWHKRKEIDPNDKLTFGWDFERYWIESLGNVFGISKDQIEELLSSVIKNEFKLDKEKGNLHFDPRSNLWNSPPNEMETYHSHGSYPKTDGYSFYLSYHAMLIVAGKLIEKMPVISRIDDYEENKWQYWIKSHSLTLANGYLLSDLLDPPPVFRRKWLSEKTAEDWSSNINHEDFIDILLNKGSETTSINVAGNWDEGDGERIENVYISSALVDPSSSQSLLHALSTCSDPHDFKLPDYKEEHMEFNIPPFILHGWIDKTYPDMGLDKMDPFTGNISFPPYTIGDFFVDKLGLQINEDGKKWCLPGEPIPSLSCQLWSTNKPAPDEEALRHGIKLSADLDFLKKLCFETKKDLIINLQIDRRFNHKYYTRKQNEKASQKAFCKIFILSQNGKLRDAEKYYSFR